MRGYLFLPSIVLVIVLFYMPTTGVSESEGMDTTAVEAQKVEQVLEVNETTTQPSTVKEGDKERIQENTTSAALSPKEELSTLPESQHQIVKLTDKDVEPLTLTMKKEDSILFFLNDSTDSLITLAIDFKDLTSHCASANMKIGDDGFIRSVRPVGPKDFASVCFHDAGTYDYTVFGMKSDPDGIKGSIIVE